MVSDSQSSTFEQAQLRNSTARVLQTGFRIAVILMAIGLVLSVVRQDSLPTNLEQPVDLAKGLADGDPGSIVGLGILAIVLTPFASTIVVAKTFFQQGNRRYAAISATVLLILLTSIGLSLL